MEEEFFISNAKNFVGKSVVVKGWVFNKRSSGAICFMQIRDGSGIIQAVVVKNEVKGQVFEKSRTITLESSLEIKGKLKEDKRAPGGYELSTEDIKVIQKADEDYPIGKKEHGVDFLLSNRHLWIRSQRQWAIFKIRAKIFQAIEEFYRDFGFTRIDTPIITPNACEGTTTLFEVDYFGDKAYLSQSGQLYLEATLASFSRVYDFTPVFRAEKSKTRRHLIEFWMTNAEIAFCDLEKVMNIQEKMIDYILKKVCKECRRQLEIIERDISVLEKIKPPFEKITYEKALKMLSKLGSDIKQGEDFGNDDETILMKHFKNPIFVTHYPAHVKAFYMKKDSKNPKNALCCDLLVPEGYGEITGGSQREDDYKVLEKSMRDHKLTVADYQWYLDLRKYGSTVHSGFGLGPERLMSWICKLKHVREAIPFPRMLERFRP